jgi:hypothetical protein
MSWVVIEVRSWKNMNVPARAKFILVIAINYQLIFQVEDL